METKDAFKEDGGKKNPIKNFCWPFSGKEGEECVRNYEDVFKEANRERGQDEK
jgi:hypothetical protein